MAEFKYAGSVSSSTMRGADLIPKFLEVLNDLQGTPGEQWHPALTAYDLPKIVNWEEWCNEHPSDASELTNDLMDRLDAEAPEGYYFGASEGDGADYGFWEATS